MPDREKVIKGLEILRDICNAKSNMAIGKGKVAWAGYANTADDALAILKEQEAKNVVNMMLSKDWFRIASCPKCNELLTWVSHRNYCGYCGQEVKWE